MPILISIPFPRSRSDRAAFLLLQRRRWVHLNGQRLFVGRNEFESRYADDLGIVDAELEAVDLPLRRGPNGQAGPRGQIVWIGFPRGVLVGRRLAHHAVTRQE